MATIINNPDSGAGNDSGGMGMIIGAIVLVLILVLFFIYGLPALRGNNGSTGNQINVPDKVDVNVETPTTAQ
jgi:hypothetical protein